jgi:hypothetical protein
MFVEYFPKLIREAGYSPEEFIRKIREEFKFTILAIDETGNNRRQARIDNAEELVAFMGAMPIVNLFLERATQA